MSRLDSLPKYFRTEPSPNVLESAFPPFKTEHRYRGVYERAGFDVNLNGYAKNKSSPSDSTSSFKQRYPSPPKSNSVSPTSQQHSIHHQYPQQSSRRGQYSSTSSESSAERERQRSQTMRSHASSSQSSVPKSYNMDMKNGNNYYHTNNSNGSNIMNTYPNANNRSGSLTGSASVTGSGSQRSNGSNNSQGNRFNPANQNAYPETLQQEPEPELDRGSFDFSPQTNASKNFKNLSIKTSCRDDIDTKSLKLGGGEQNRMEYPSIDEQQYNGNVNTELRDISSTEAPTEAPTAAPAPYQPKSKYQPKSRYAPSKPNSTNQYYHGYNDDTSNPSFSAHDQQADQSVDSTFDSSNKTGLGLSLTPSQTQTTLSSIGTDELNQSQAPIAIDMDAAGVNYNAPIDPPYPVSRLNSVKGQGELERDDSFIRKKRLSSALDDFKRDIEDVKKNTPQLQQREAFSPEGQTEYQKFLSLGDSTGKQYPRHSQLSMVSSILSKGSLNDEDAEIEKELERQLQSLKTGEDSKLKEAAVVVPEAVPEIPTFNIQQEGEYVQDEEKKFHELDQQSDHRYSMEESTPPLSFIKGQEKEKEEEIPQQQEQIPIQHATSQPTFEVTAPQSPILDQSREIESPENQLHLDESPLAPLNVNHSVLHQSPGIEPLNPHTHNIGEELKEINFPVEIPSQPITTEEEIFPPGEGPCRSCHKPILPNSTGSNRAIFSKTGELSGQWHRACFLCSKEGCDVKFQKGIQCYELNDKPYCHGCYHELNGSLCGSCFQGIEGECIENELQQKWHLECLCCHQCQSGITEDYYLVNGKVFCEEDALDRIRQQQSSRSTSRADKIEKRRTRLLFLD
ncbi:hypothetical protein CAAN4_F12200 [[Candida] anglica]|uniref:LIM zinc-binding domain-containing protein n=1 Tax=[Candida] anglica TaxID=148631 RepID=A0ABP0EI28_9ASCO